MSTRLYVKSGVTAEQVPNIYPHSGADSPYIFAIYSKFRDLKGLDQTVMKYVEYITVRDSYWKYQDGYSFASGVYESEAFKVIISPSVYKNSASDKNPLFDYYQEIDGRFDTIEIAIAFWEALTRGEILPTRPICRELSVTEQAYAKQAAAGVAAMAKLSDLESRIEQLLNQVKSLGQVVQDHVLIPKGQ